MKARNNEQEPLLRAAVSRCRKESKHDVWLLRLQNVRDFFLDRRLCNPRSEDAAVDAGGSEGVAMSSDSSASKQGRKEKDSREDHNKRIDLLPQLFALPLDDDHDDDHDLPLLLEFDHPQEEETFGT